MKRYVRDLTLLRPCGRFKVTDVPQSEGDALIWLYKHTTGPSWTNHTNWLVTHTVANWFGVTVAGGHVTQVLLNSNGLNGNIGAFPIGSLPSLTQLQLHINGVSGNVGGWTLLAPLAVLSLHTTGVSGNVGGWTLPASLTYLYLQFTSVSGNVGGWTLPASLIQLFIQSTSVSGTPDISGNTSMQNYRYQDCALIQANVDAILLSVYTRRAAFTNAAPALNVGGTNAAPSGVYADEDPPVTGKGIAFELVNDPEAEGFNKWAITFTA